MLKFSINSGTHRQLGFTLIELMIVIAIIGVLTSIGIISFSQARDKANYAKAKADMDTLKKAMLWYKLDIEELPPPGDNCSACSNPPNSSWTWAVDTLIQGGYLVNRIDKDPWGNYYGYDDNDCNSNPGESYLFTAGSDKKSWTSDDYRITITPGC